MTRANGLIDALTVVKVEYTFFPTVLNQATKSGVIIIISERNIQHLPYVLTSK